jgi:hypothetical protein
MVVPFPLAADMERAEGDGPRLGTVRVEVKVSVCDGRIEV